MTRFLETLGKKPIILDGAMGTMLQINGLPAGACPEGWMLENPEAILHIHKEYLNAGAQIIETNTFGGSRLKLQEFDLQDKTVEINHKAAELAREAVGNEAFVAGIIGPTGHFPRPNGSLSFSQLYDVFFEQAQALASGGVDLIYLQTFSDIGEARIALLAAKAATNLPVACSLTYTNQRTLTGTDPYTGAVILEALGADIIGTNCSGGPEHLLPIIAEMKKATNLPLLIEPNAGLPIIKDGQTIFPMNPSEFVAFVDKFISAGATIIGGCCGTSPEHIRYLSSTMANKELKHRGILHPLTRLASPYQTVEISDHTPPIIIGERINPTARKIIKEAIIQQDWAQLVAEGQSQESAGAHLLDVNVGVPSIDEVEALEKAVISLQEAVTSPLVLDSTNPIALERALQSYSGKALINSVNGEVASLEAILPLAKKYGAAIIGLTLDERGIPSNAQERLEIAERIVNEALKYGISKEDIFIDCLVMTVGSNPEGALITVEAIKEIKEKLGVKTVLGVSNISHGMPQRPWLNNAFITLALGAGLDAAIANPLDQQVWQNIWSTALLVGRDSAGIDYISKATANDHAKEEIGLSNDLPSLEKLGNAVLKGKKKEAIALLQWAIQENLSPMTIINEGLIPGLNKIGEAFSKGKAFLPQLLLAGETASLGFDILNKELKDSHEKVESKGTIVLGTVKGDIHDIGKNIVSTLMKTHGWNVIDLGKNVPKETFVKAAIDNKANIVGLSALMTTTMTEMPEIIKNLKQTGANFKVIVGGAVVTQEYANEIGAHGYAPDAVQAIKLAEALWKKE